MFARFSGGDRHNKGQNGGAWPLSKVKSALESQYGALEMLGEDGPLCVYGVQENGINFVVALMQTGPGTGKIAELGFLARFVGFDVDAMLVETLNRNLHIAMVSIEGEDLFLMAGLEASGAYDAAKFNLMLEGWRRDLMVTLAGLSNNMASMTAAFPAARIQAARNFATNVAPAPADNRPIDMLASFLGGKASKAVCDECDGRGKRGLIARLCDACDGSGFVNAR